MSRYRCVSHLCPHLSLGCKPANEAAAVTAHRPHGSDLFNHTHPWRETSRAPSVQQNGEFILAFIGTTALTLSTDGA